MLLNRIAGSTKAGLFLFTSPAAVCLTVGYSESVFLAFAVAAWYAAQRGEWSAVPLLAGLAGLARLDGLALIPALVVFGLVRPGTTTRLRAAGAAASALFGPFLYVFYLRLVTGSWNAWQEASRAGWNLKIDWPLVSLRDSYRNAYETHWEAAFYPWSWSFELELVCSISQNGNEAMKQGVQVALGKEAAYSLTYAAPAADYPQRLAEVAALKAGLRLE